MLLQFSRCAALVVFVLAGALYARAADAPANIFPNSSFNKQTNPGYPDWWNANRTQEWRSDWPACWLTPRNSSAERSPPPTAAKAAAQKVKAAFKLERAAKKVSVRFESRLLCRNPLYVAPDNHQVVRKASQKDFLASGVLVTSAQR